MYLLIRFETAPSDKIVWKVFAEQWAWTTVLEHLLHSNLSLFTWQSRLSWRGNIQDEHELEILDEFHEENDVMPSSSSVVEIYHAEDILERAQRVWARR